MLDDQGMSPNIARSILFHAHVMDDIIVSKLSDEQLQQLYKHFAAWASLFLEKSVHEVVRDPRIVHYDLHHRNFTEFVPISFTESTSWTPTKDIPTYLDQNSISTFLSRFYSVQERQNEFMSLRTACTKKLLIRQKVILSDVTYHRILCTLFSYFSFVFMILLAVSDFNNDRKPKKYWTILRHKLLMQAGKKLMI